MSSGVPGWILRHGQAPFALLLEAHEYVLELDCSPWDFAVEIAALYEAGLSTSALRWLVCKGYVQHGWELTRYGDRQRSFRYGEGLRFAAKTCFTLTETGNVFLRCLLDCEPTSGLTGPLDDDRDGNGSGCIRPTWDGSRRELYVGRLVIKQFRVPAANQEAILTAFEEEDWPTRIDDPLVPHPEQDSKRRLHDTIRSLNRSQKHPLIHFSGDGTGEGIRWKFHPLNPDPADGDGL